MISLELKETSFKSDVDVGGYYVSITDKEPEAGESLENTLVVPVEDLETFVLLYQQWKLNTLKGRTDEEV